MATETMIPVQERQQPLFLHTLRKCFSFPVLMGALLIALNAVIMFPTFRLGPDTWWHMKYGDMILHTGHWPTVDTWSFTVHGMPRVAYEWGGEVLTALAYRLGGLRGMELLLYALTSVILLEIFYFAWLRCRNSKAALVAAVLTLPMAGLCFTLRPRLLGYIFLLIVLILLERFRQGELKSLWVLPLVFLVWVNTHGSFALGFMVLGLYWLCGLVDFSAGGLHAVRWRPEQRLHLELMGLLSVAVLPLTPYGTRLAAVPVEVATSLSLNFAGISEWQPLNAGMWEAKLLLALLFAFIVAQIAFRFRYRLEELALFVLFTYLAFLHLRFTILCAIVFSPLVASILSRWTAPYDPAIDKYALNAILMFITLGAIVWYFPSRAALHKHVAKEYPVQAVGYLQRHPIPGRMFNEYFFGGYLVWRLAPQHQVFIDGRGDIYERAGVFSAYMDVVALKADALAVLKSYQINSCLVHRDDSLATLLSASPHWKRIYRDELAAIYVREKASVRASIRPVAPVAGELCRRNDLGFQALKGRFFHPQSGN